MDDQIRELWQVERNAAVAHFADAEIREKIAEVLHEYQYTGLERARKFLPESLSRSPEVFWKVIVEGLRRIQHEIVKNLFDRCFEPRIFLVPQYEGNKVVQAIDRHKPASQMGLFGDVHAPRVGSFLTPARSEIQVILTDASPSALSNLDLCGDKIRLRFDQKSIELADSGLDIADPATVLLVMHDELHRSENAVLDTSKKTIVELNNRTDMLAEIGFSFGERLQMYVYPLSSGARVPWKAHVKPKLCLGSVVLSNDYNILVPDLSA